MRRGTLKWGGGVSGEGSRCAEDEAWANAMLVIRERSKRNPTFDRKWAAAGLQTLGKGGKLVPVPTELLGRQGGSFRE